MIESLLKCTLKKGAATFWKHLKYAAWIAVGLAVMVGLYLMGTAILPLAMTVLALVEIVTSNILAVLASVPWWVYALAAVPVAYLGYGFLWCVARDLIEDDWKSDAANAFALTLAAFALALAPALTPALTLAALALAFAALAAIFTVDPVDKITVWYFIFRFPGAAWHHYHKQSEQERAP